LDGSAEHFTLPAFNTWSIPVVGGGADDSDRYSSDGDGIGSDTDADGDVNFDVCALVRAYRADPFAAKHRTPLFINL
jgi:hypothetical protein